MIWPDLDSTIYIHHVILFSISIASGPAMTERHPLRLSRKKKSFLTKRKIIIIIKGTKEEKYPLLIMEPQIMGAVTRRPSRQNCLCDYPIINNPTTKDSGAMQQRGHMAKKLVSKISIKVHNYSLWTGQPQMLGPNMRDMIYI